MGIVVFGNEAFTQCPLTLDHRVLKEFVDSLEVGMAGQATAIGEGLAIALKRIRDIPAKSKVVVLVTDGKSNAGNVTPEQAAEIARELGIKVHVVGIGGNEPAPFPVRSAFGGTRLVMRELEYDAATLKMIAEKTGGRYFNAKDLSALQQVYAEIDQLEERHEAASEYVEYSERFLPLVALGLTLFLLSELLSATVLLKVP
jgi:Ca-activated chloride channel family protein